MSHRRITRAMASVFVSMVVLVGSLAGIGPISAQAAESSVPPPMDNPSNAVTGDALPTAQINGVVWDQVVVGNTVYAAGQFTSVRPAGSPAGTNESPRQNLMSYNLITGVATSWAPQVNGRIRTIAASPDGSRIYIGGSFSQVNGQVRSRIAAFNTSDGSLVGSFAPRVGSDVFGIAATNTKVYLGGWFTAVNSVPRTRLAAVSASNGATLDWAPAADFTVYGLGLTDAEDRVVVSGSFSNLNGQPATSLGSLDAVTGESFPFAANQVIHNTGNSASMMSLKVVDDRAFSTAFWYGGTGNFEGAVVMDPYNGSILNLMNCLGDTYDAVPMNGIVYQVSHHHQCIDSGGFPEFTPRTWQHTDGFSLEATGSVQRNSYGYPNFEGHPSGSYVNWFPTMVPGAASGSEQAGWTIEAQGEYLVVGGEFIRVNGTDQQGLVRFATRNVVQDPSIGPSGHSNDTRPRLDSLSATSVRVRFMADFDRDGRTLSYKVVRNDLGEASPVYTVSGESNFWDRPWFQFVDTGLVEGRAYAYRVIATDADGNSREGYPALVTAGANVPDDSAYARQVAADGATNFWRLRDAVGSTYAVDYGTAGVDLNAGAGVTFGRPGAIIGSTDTAAQFSGTQTGLATSAGAQQAPDVFSTELWFRTTTTSGGKLLGFGNTTSGNSSSYDRHIYMDDSGRLTFGVYPGGTRTVTSAKAYNDGEWHHAVATLSPAGMTLHVDGLRVGANPSVTTGQQYVGYWRVGGDQHGGWPNAGSSNYFAGDIDDVAIYPTALSQVQIRDHYTSSGRTVELPPLPADPYGAAVAADEPIIQWRLDDTGTTAVDLSGNSADGTYHNGPVQGVASAVVPGNAAASFDGVDDLVSTNASYDNPTVFSIEGWFNTVSTQGGKVIGFGRSQTGNSGSYDRHIYLSPSGRVNFGAYTGATHVASTAGAYNDGEWHHVVGTLGPDGMHLYVDGVLQATHPNTGAENYLGYWRVGGDNSWDGAPYLAGTIDEVAVYDRVLAKDQVQRHYKASPAARNALPTATIEGECRLGTCSLTANASDPDGVVTDLAWDLGDGNTATGPSVTHTYATAGTYTVTLTVTDDSGATATTTRTVEYRQPRPAPTDTYGARVMVDEPLLYWRLGETGGSVAEDSSPFVHDGTYRGGVTLGNASPVAGDDRAAGFAPGGMASSDDRFTNPTVFSLEAWFNTTGTGGRIIGFGNQQDVRSNNYDRHVFLDQSGRAVFGVWSGGSHTITSADPLNDGAWHHVVATMGPTGMSLYVDGNLVGTNPNTSMDPYDGYWRVGADNVWSGNGDFNGLIDEAAVYGQVLSAATVRDHHRVSGAFVNTPPTATFDVQRDGLSIAVDGTASADSDGTIATWAWDFGDGTTATEGTAGHTYASAGTYTVTLTVTDDLGATTTATRQVTVREPLPAPRDAYATEVLGDGPVLYWRLDEATGDTAFDRTPGTHDGTYRGDITREVPSPLANGNPAAGLDPEEFVASDDRFTNPTTFSVETWFRTASASGRIIGFGDSNDARSGTVDRQVFLDGSGRLAFAAGDGPAGTITSPSAYNDDQWHHVVATLGPAGRALYVDGVLVAENAEPGTRPLDGYWRVGTDNTGSGDGGFAGTVDEVAVYPVVLTADRVAAHHAASSAVNHPPVASFTLSSDGLAVAADATGSTDDGSIVSWAWSFGDGTTATGVTAAHTYQQAGTYQVTLTVTDNEGATAFTSQNVTVSVPNQPPVAAFTSVVNDLTVTFDSAGSSDPDGAIASWAWDFGDGATSTEPTPEHVYAAPGTYSVTLTVTDHAGATGAVTHDVTTTAPNTAPTAAFTSAVNGLAVDFDGTGSTDDGTITEWAWDFGDGNGAHGSTVSHSYAEEGTYRVSLRVTDDRGATGTVTHDVTVTAPPAATVLASDAFGRTGTSWGTADVGGPWTLTGAGFTTDGSTGGVSIASAGSTRTARLDAVSAADVTMTGEFSFNHPPQGATYIQQVWARSEGTTSRYSMQLRWETSGSVRLLLARTVGGSETILRTVSLTGLTYNQGDVWKYRFDVHGSDPSTLEAKVWKSTATEPAAPMATATDSSAGLQDAGAVALRFYTGGGTTGLPFRIAVDNFLVRPHGDPAAPNTPPTAAFTATPDGLAVAVDASASGDADGSIATYAWTFGDGATATGRTASHTYTAAGTYDIVLTVTDDDGATATTTRRVTVTEPVNAPPTAGFTVSVAGLDAAFDASGSSDPDGSIASYAWDFGDGRTDTGATTTHTYAAAGTYEVVLTVTDDDGATATSRREVSVAPLPDNVIAVDEFARTGNGWGTADVGGPWTVNSTSTFATDGSSGVVTIGTAASTRIARLAQVSARDVSVVTDLTLDKAPAGGTYQHQIRARIDEGSTNLYTMTLRFIPNGSLEVNLTRTVGGSETILRGVTLNRFNYVAGERINVRFDVVGDGTTTLSGRVWRGNDEPAAPTVTVTDATQSLQRAGAVGTRFYTGGGTTSIPLRVSVDRFAVEAR